MDIKWILGVDIKWNGPKNRETIIQRLFPSPNVTTDKLLLLYNKTIIEFGFQLISRIMQTSLISLNKW